jgi:hypothetical protein
MKKTSTLTMMVLCLVVSVSFVGEALAKTDKKKAAKTAEAGLPPEPDRETVVEFTGTLTSGTMWTVTPSQGQKVAERTLAVYYINSGEVGVTVLFEGKPEDLVGKEVVVRGFFTYPKKNYVMGELRIEKTIRAAIVLKRTPEEDKKKLDEMVGPLKAEEAAVKDANKQEAKTSAEKKK